MVDVAKISQQVVSAVGGKDNIKAMEHCSTRLRIMVKNEDLVKVEEIKQLKDAKGYFFQTGQHQIIFGTGLVNKVYNELANLDMELSSVKDEVYQKMNFLQKLSRVFGDIFIPIIPVVVVTGLFMGLRGFILSMGIELSPQMMVLSGILTDTAFIFFTGIYHVVSISKIWWIT